MVNSIILHYSCWKYILPNNYIFFNIKGKLEAKIMNGYRRNQSMMKDRTLLLKKQGVQNDAELQG